MEDLKQLLHALGLGLSYRTVKELSTFATDLRRSERVYYRVSALLPACGCAPADIAAVVALLARSEAGSRSALHACAEHACGGLRRT